MKPNYVVRMTSLVVLASATLTAQVARQGDVPLKNWATPLYWQPNQAERAQPQLVFSTNAVSTNALTFVAITPCRLVDTRGAAAGFNGADPFAGPSIASKGTLTIPVQSTTEATTNTEPAPCGMIPSIAQAYSFNLTVVPHAGGAVDYVSLWPAGGTQPFVATLNDPQGAIVSNAAIVPAGTPTGGISVYNDGPAIADVIIDMNGYFTAPTDVSFNTAIGASALAANTTGSGNTASGANALASNTNGSYNTASGYQALEYNVGGTSPAGSGNTATGYESLQFNTTGSYNVADGLSALRSNATGYQNTASGFDALANNTSGIDNTASGAYALESNTTGGENTASGIQALSSNTTGSGNTAIGEFALDDNTTGQGNTANGAGALSGNTTGNNNVANGAGALNDSTTGSNNIALGYDAGYNVSTGNYNIHIGNLGVSTDSGVIRIGAAGNQTSAYIAGITGVGVSGSAVYVTGSGQLGIQTSSRRFKEQITDMGDSSSKLLQLRPVNFFYKPEYDDGSHLLQYGLIAEEVEKVYPEMVAYDKDGQILTVKYQMLAPMLLNEVQKQNAQLQNQNAQLQEQVQLQQEENRKLEDRLAALEARPANSQ